MPAFRNRPPYVGIVWLLAAAGFCVACDDGGGGAATNSVDGTTDVDSSASDATGASDQGPDGALPDAGEMCAAGTEDCRCLDNGTCRVDGLDCQEGVCRGQAECDPLTERCAPANPVCFSPCRGDVLAEDGSLRSCQPNGLLKGCLGEQICFQGSCTPPGAPNAIMHAVGECARESECPAFQTCIEGRCYSTCGAGLGDCLGETEICHLQVCRESCDQDAACERSGYACFTGVCLPVAEASDIDDPPVRQAFTLSTSRLSFTKSSPQSVFSLQNTGAVALTVQLTALEHTTREADGTDRVVTEDALSWIDFPSEVIIPAGGRASVEITGADGGPTQWEGRIRIGGEGLPNVDIRLIYSNEVTGRWSGKAYVFGNFNDTNLDAWLADRSDTSTLDVVPNAFLQAWGRYRNGGIELSKMAAVLDATLTGSWDFPRVRELCREDYDEGTACVPFGGTGSQSVLNYTTESDEIPTGIVEMDFALHLRESVGAECDAERCLVGRIDSASALQYGANPAVTLSFGADPTGCSRVDAAAGCMMYLDGLDAQIVLGARFAPAAGEGCQGGSLKTTPWLVPGLAPASGESIERRECRDRLAPFVEAADNIDYAAANPILDGRRRMRRLELIDGVIIEQHVMSLILKETVDTFDGGSFASYLYVVLERAPSPLDSGEAEGNSPAEPGPAIDLPPPVACAPRFAELLGSPSVEAADADTLARLVVGGGESGDAIAPEQVRTLCVWSEDRLEVDAVGAQVQVRPEDDPIEFRRQRLRGFVETRSSVDSGADGRPCFPGADVYFFTGSLNTNECNELGQERCLEKLTQEVSVPGSTLRLGARLAALLEKDEIGLAPGVRTDLAYRCTDPQVASCDNDRYDLRRGKTFFVAPAQASLQRLQTQIAQAYRYKRQFVTREGTGPGFAPEICRGGRSLRPYCYDPAEIARIRERVDCALSLATSRRDELSPAVTEALTRFLDENFSALQVDRPDDDPVLQYGFEHLDAELLIMLGDDAYTASFASRFDLAGAVELAFEGSAFEEGGPDLSGPIGYEMYKLYQAQQYYDLVLERFHRLSELLWTNLAEESSFVSAATVVTYLDRVIRASTQSARIWGEIAARYHSLNLSDLSKRVLQRAYSRAYQESLLLTAFMNGVIDTVDTESAPQVAKAIVAAQRRYRVAFLAMRDQFQQVSLRTDSFGLPPDFIPFPALDEGDVNGFDLMLGRAIERVALAAEDELAAIESSRDFDSSEASFQAELVQLRNGYEDSLGQVCGTFVADDGRTYPAIARYAHLDERTRKLDDPCGSVGNGSLWLAGSDLQSLELAVQRVQMENRNTLEAIDDAIDWVAVQCRMQREDATRFLKDSGSISNLEAGISRMEVTIGIADKVLDFVTEFTDRVGGVAEDADKPWSAALKASQNIVYSVAAAVNLAGTTSLEVLIANAQNEIRQLEGEYESFTITRECDYLNAELVYTVRGLYRELALSRLDTLEAVWGVQVGFSDIQALNNERTRLEAEWRDAEALTVEGAAAAADPNVRIFKNSVILNADHSFDRALLAAWKATRTYEYYTASSYPEREQLNLIRMVNAGDLTLRRYVNSLEDAFNGFEQQYGNPDTRVATISLHDDILRLPNYSTDGENRVLTIEQKAAALRAALRDPSNLDERGALTFRFATDFTGLSPLTRNHKILFIEVEIFGDELGDEVGRIYLRQLGTGVVDGTDDRRRFFAFAPRTAVMNPFFNGERGRGQDSNGAIAGPTRSIYRSYRFRERPFVQSSWELVLDQRNESVNQDIKLGGIQDIVFYVFYTDFTQD